MPYVVRKVPGGYKVFKQGTNTSYSKKPQTEEEANAQMRALYAAEKKRQTENPVVYR